MEFTVADRNGDLSDETIRWEWSGTPADPLTRKVNGGAAVNMLDDVYDFTLAYNHDEVTTTESSGGESTSDEYLMESFEGWSGITPSMLAYNVGPTTRAAESFAVTGIPAEATRSQSRAPRFDLRQNSGGNVQVSVHKTQRRRKSEPATAQIGNGATVNVATSGRFDWVDIDFTDVESDSCGRSSSSSSLPGSITTPPRSSVTTPTPRRRTDTYHAVRKPTSWSPPRSCACIRHTVSRLRHVYGLIGQRNRRDAILCRGHGYRRCG